MTWYLTPPALSIIETIRADPPRRVVKQRYYYQTRDEWQVFEGPSVDALNALHTKLFYEIEATGDHDALLAMARAGTVQDVIAAVLECPLPGTHFTYDRERLASIAAAVSAALTPTMEEVA